MWSPDWTTFREYGEKRWRSRVRELLPDDLAPFRPVIGPDRNAPKAPKVKKAKAAPAPAAPVADEPATHLPKGTTLAAAVGLDPAPVEAPTKPARKTAAPKRAAAQVAEKRESLGQLKNRARMAKGETKIRLVAQIAREHGAAAAAELVPGLATEVPGVNNLPAVGVTG